MQQFSFEAIGSHFEVTAWDEIPQADFLALQRELIALAQRFDARYSRFIKDSLVWQIAEETGHVQVDKEFVDMLKVYFSLYQDSNRRFTPLIGQAARDTGYDEAYSLKPKNVIALVPDLEKTIRIVSDDRIEVAQPVLFDFGGVGKGWLIDKLANVMQAKGCKRFLINGSGDIFYKGDGQPIQVALEHPTDSNKAAGMLEIRQGALAASGIGKRDWGAYHHVLDPTTLSSPREILGTWAVADTALEADVMATCLLLCTPENFTKNHQFSWAAIDKSGRLAKSPDFPGTFY